jgi:predicted phosphodiesterase
MRIAVLSDLHSNVHALQAVLDRLEHQQIDRVFVLGDIFGYYPWALQVYTLLQALPYPATVIKGNHDEMIMKRQQDASWPVNAAYAGAIMQNLAEITDTPAWEWLQALSFHQECSIDGLHFALIHGTPDDAENGRYYPDNTHVFPWFPVAGQYLLMGHTHYPLTRHLPSGGIMLNPGSVGQPRDGDTAASYAIIDTKLHTQEHFRVAYDHERAMRELRELNWPEPSIMALNKTQRRVEVTV